MSYKIRLKVQRINQTCLFELSWGNGQQLNCTLNYPETLTTAYQEWQRVYLSFYNSAQMPLATFSRTEPKTSLRGRVEASGDIAAPPIDWHGRLVQAEARLLYEFHQWLRSGELFEIRALLARAASGRMNDEPGRMDNLSYQVDLFITCSPIDLERLPWEAWEIGAEFASSGAIRIARTPANIRLETSRTRRGKARVLAIVGDDRGLDFQADRNAVRSLSRVADVEFVGWQPGQDVAQVKANIRTALADRRGWDVLLFAGHSNETAIAGGELAIAPGASVSINEIAPQLQVAKSRGLQFALFNSCSGLSLANSLIDLGLSQVAVMREPIHNRVAQEFLVRFLQVLAEYKDVGEAMLVASQHLKLEKNLTYPSASLIPSLFCHPDAVLFRIQPFGLRSRLKQLLPIIREASALSILLFVSWQLSVQDFLLERRVLVQAVYRQATNQLPRVATPPVLLVHIDDKSIQKAGLSENPRPMDRTYLAKLVDRLKVLNAKVVGLDYLLDLPQKDKDARLARSLQLAVQDGNEATWFVFAKIPNGRRGWIGVRPEIASPNWSLHGHIQIHGWYMELVPRKNSSQGHLPFAYLLALAHKLHVESLPGSAVDDWQLMEARHDRPSFKAASLNRIPSGEAAPLTHQGDTRSVQARESKSSILQLPQPALQSQTDFFSQIASYITQTEGQDYKSLFSETSRLQPITRFSYRLGQMWLHPIVDFSIPPKHVYRSIPAWKLLKADASIERSLKQSLPQQVAIIAAGGYDEAGISTDGQDNFPLPAAVDYWLKSGFPFNPRQVLFTGGEIHAYMVHHLLNQRLVIPIPDLWAIGVAAILGKGIAIAIHRRHKQGRKWTILLVSTTAVYGLVSVQAYISAAILLPWFLPSLTIWTFAIPALIEKKLYS